MQVSRLTQMGEWPRSFVCRERKKILKKSVRGTRLSFAAALFSTQKWGDGKEGNCVPRFPRLVARWASLPSLSSRANCDRSRQRHIFC